MSFESVQAWFREHAPEVRLIEGHGSTATVLDAAETLGVEPGRIAKTLSVRVGAETFLLVTRGDARIDNQKCKAEFGGRPRIFSVEQPVSEGAECVVVWGALAGGGVLPPTHPAGGAE